MGDAGSMSVLAQDTLTGAGVQTVTGAKTFNNQTLKLRNPANTFSLTFQDPPITADQTYRLNQAFKYIIFREGSTVYCRNQLTQDIESSVGTTTPETVFNYALANSTRSSIFVCPGSYTMSAGFTGLTVASDEVRLIMDPGVLLTVPNGYTGSLFILNDVSIPRIEGGRLDEGGTPAKLWTALDFNVATTGRVVGGTYEKMYIRHAGNCIRLKTDIDGWINANTFQNIYMDTSVIDVVFEHTGTFTQGQSGCNSNAFVNCTMQGGVGNTNGIKDVNGRRNIFVNCYVADFTGAQVTMNITANARNTHILGGTCTNLNFTDLTPAGSETWIRDEVSGDVARFRKTVNYEDIVAMTAPASPSTGTVRRYVKTIDANNDGLFEKRRLNGAVVEVQIG